jgi:hypothetical protein
MSTGGSGDVRGKPPTWEHGVEEGCGLVGLSGGLSETAVGGWKGTDL